MKLQTALFLLGQTLPTLAKVEDAVSTEHSLNNGFIGLLVDDPKSLFSKRQKRRRLESRVLLQNRRATTTSDHGVLRNSLDIVECNPNSEQIDVGVLSCGAYMYCAQSEKSSLGGICTPEQDLVSNERRLENDDLCSHLKDGHFFDSCDCTNFDSATQSGTVDCFKEDDCFHDFGLVDLCATLYARFDADADGSYTYEYSYDFHSPYDRSYSFRYQHPDATCQITVDSTICKSCEETACGVQFDCSNTAVGTQRLNCGSSVNILPIFDDVLFRGKHAVEDADIDSGLAPHGGHATEIAMVKDASGCRRDLNAQIFFGLGVGAAMLFATL